MRRSFVLYRFYDHADVLLYVGLTADPGRRITQHRAQKPWWPAVSRVELEHFATMAEVRTAEAIAIREEGPLYNIHMQNLDPDAIDWSQPAIQNSFGTAIFRGAILGTLQKPRSETYRTSTEGLPEAARRFIENAYIVAHEKAWRQATGTGPAITEP